MRFHRVYAGYYTRETDARLADGSTRRVEVCIRHIPEWPKPDQWALTIEFVGRPGGSLVSLSDAIGPTMASMRQEAALLLEEVWEYRKGLGWCHRTGELSR